MSMHPLQFSSLSHYSKVFTNPEYWQPYVDAVFARHRLGPYQELHAGLPGTYPVFIADDRYVVKFFSPYFHGAKGFAVEREVYQLLKGAADLPVPTLLAQDELFPGEDWSWPYLVMTALADTSLGDVRDGLDPQELINIAIYLGQTVRKLHSLDGQASRLLRASWRAFRAFLVNQYQSCEVRYRGWGCLPESLVAELAAYLPPLDVLLEPRAKPYLLHSDLGEDHLLGTFRGKRWHPRGIIDFADARLGDRFYDLVTLHLSLFRCDKSLLRAFLSAYGFDKGLQRNFSRRAMGMTLLHEFDVLGPLFVLVPEARDVSSLSKLERLLWDLDQPGLVATGTP